MVNTADRPQLLDGLLHILYLIFVFVYFLRVWSFKLNQVFPITVGSFLELLVGGILTFYGRWGQCSGSSESLSTGQFL